MIMMQNRRKEFTAQNKYQRVVTLRDEKANLLSL